MAGDYVSMQTRILDELLTGASITTAQVKLEILSAIRHYERQRFWFNEGTATGTTTALQTTANGLPPADLLEIDKIDVLYNGHPFPLSRWSWERYVDIAGRDTTVGRTVPGQFIYYANAIYLYPVPDNTYTLTMSYLKQLTALSADSDTNNWTTDGEELIRCRARQAVKLNYTNDDGAMQEAAALATRGQGYLSGMEMVAYNSLLSTAVGRISTGRLTPTRF